MKIVILGGFLGSGKTSVLMSLARKYAAGAQEGEAKVVIIENEIGEVGVDDKLLKNGGYQVENMFAGCICCSMAGDIVNTLTDIESQVKPDLVIIESSGVGYPFNIRETIETKMGEPSTICCVVDAVRWKRIFRAMEITLRDQLKDANYILVNKIDLVDADTVSATHESVQAVVPEAKVFDISAMAGLDEELIDMILG